MKFSRHTEKFLIFSMVRLLT